MVQHYSDTRTSDGRVRFLLDGKAAVLLTEGPGWQQQDQFASVHDAVLGLALISRVPQPLYDQALDDLYHQLYFFGQPGAA
ncbi:hypothetical protein GCM10022631_08350 [Deinococcus rubellus]|uniref:Uncharacterized protein n=1 Tax=Deinococcus rubellus TaxID=1889240 RepID=A0ABY5YG48_9DEIO|nr:hypothetical protein [Deinococcus rubellus]UWX63820.1 hypothetical protein N0D28_13970 [Deinococcus rubellus]